MTPTPSTPPVRARASTRTEPWPIAILGFFAVLIVVVVGFVIWSTTQRVDLVTRDYYAREIAYQDRIEDTRRALALDPPLSVVYDAASQMIQVTYPNQTGGSGATGEIWVYRPSSAALDFRLPVAPDEAGQQFVSSANMRPGLWKLRLQWQAEGQRYFDEVAVVVDSPGPRGR